MALHPIEEATLRAFVLVPRRQRMLALFGSARHRKKARQELNHFVGWDPRWAQVVRSSSSVLSILREAGAPSECHLMADNQDLDGRDMPLDEAVSAAYDESFASVLCCLPGRLAFYFDEVWAPRRLLLLRRPGP